jgi:hypothetical protein
MGNIPERRKSVTIDWNNLSYLDNRLGCCPHSFGAKGLCSHCLTDFLVPALKSARNHPVQNKYIHPLTLA